MKLKFLCSTHKQWLANEPQQAMNCWLNGFETGQVLCDKGQWREALPYIGCAFESAEIILTIVTSHSTIQRKDAISYFVSSSIFLADTLLQIGATVQAKEIYRVASSRLERELLKGDTQEYYISKNLDCLARGLQRLCHSSEHQPKVVNMMGRRRSLRAVSERLVTESVIAERVVH